MCLIRNNIVIKNAINGILYCWHWHFVFRGFYDFYPVEDIRFWRTQKKQEVDFIIEEKKAYEVKFSSKNYIQQKYYYFKKKYPDIPLSLIDIDNVLELKL